MSTYRNKKFDCTVKNLFSDDIKHYNNKTIKEIANIFKRHPETIKSLIKTWHPDFLGSKKRVRVIIAGHPGNEVVEREEPQILYLHNILC